MSARTITIGRRVVGDGQPCFVIAEGGVNHNGDALLAGDLVRIAADCKADAVKCWEDVLERNPGNRSAEMYLNLVKDSPKVEST